MEILKIPLYAAQKWIRPGLEPQFPWGQSWTGADLNGLLDMLACFSDLAFLLALNAL